MLKNILFIGSLNIGELPLDGETAKNQILYDYLKLKYPNIEYIDTINWKKTPSVIFKLFLNIFIFSNKKIILSICPDSAYRLSKILYFSGRQKNLHYFVIGGSFAKKISSKEYNLKFYYQYKAIYVEGKSMVKELNKNGLQNIKYLPNFKNFNKQLLETRVLLPNLKSKIHFVFLSRITKSKGAELIIDAIRILNSQHYTHTFDVTFYGKIEESFKFIFEEKLMSLQNVNYKGILDLRSDAGFKILASYDVMLFPTYWHGEGFPGIIVDAFIAGLPIIASDWNLNAEIIINNKTGFIVPPNDLDSLVKMMKYVIENKQIIYDMKINCINEAKYFHIDNVMNQINI